MQSNKKPGIIKNILSIMAERAKARKAIRVLSKQEWSLEFIVWLCSEAASKYKQKVAFTIKNGNNELVIHSGSDAQALVARGKKIDEMDEQERLNAMLDVAAAQGIV